MRALRRVAPVRRKRERSDADENRTDGQSASNDRAANDEYRREKHDLNDEERGEEPVARIDDVQILRAQIERRDDADHDRRRERRSDERSGARAGGDRGDAESAADGDRERELERMAPGNAEEIDARRVKGERRERRRIAEREKKTHACDERPEHSEPSLR